MDPYPIRYTIYIYELMIVVLPDLFSQVSLGAYAV